MGLDVHKLTTVTMSLFAEWDGSTKPGLAPHASRSPTGQASRPFRTSPLKRAMSRPISGTLPSPRERWEFARVWPHTSLTDERCLQAGPILCTT